MATITDQQAAAFDALVAAQSASRSALSQVAVDTATSQVAAMQEAAWYDDKAVAQLAYLIGTQVGAVQRQTAALTDAYLARMTSLTLGRTIKPVGVGAVDQLRGITNTLVYQRLGENYRYLRSVGKTHEAAVTDTSQRAAIMADTDATLAMRAQSRRFMQRRQITTYRRIIRPEASKGGVCGLCIAASDRLYYKADLLPIHDRCHCETAPIVGGKDPGHNLNQADLDNLYGAAGSTGREDLKRIKVQIHHHGELGPVLAKLGQKFTGPNDLPNAA